MDTNTSKLIDIAHLRKGMFVQLDMGWMSHPFAADSFKVTTDEQVQTLRSLGLAEVRYVPSKSDVAVVEALAYGLMPGRAGAAGPDEDAALLTQHRQDLLETQGQSLQFCGQQFSGAVGTYEQVARLLTADPAAARDHSVALVKACVNTLRNNGESAIRLLPDLPGERNAMHPVNVMVVSLLLGKALGQSDQELLDLGVAALLHDVGKLQLPERVRSLDRHFAPEEILAYQSHVAFSVAAAERMGLSPAAIAGIAQHHEMVDGSGFPLKLHGSQISTQGKIIALVNRYDNLCNPLRDGSIAFTPHEALSVLFAQMKARFDSAVLGAFIRMMGVYPPGSVVQLVNDRFAMVVSVNSSRPLRPRIIVHDTRVPRQDALVLDMEAMPELGIRRSLKPAQLPVAAYEYLMPRERICCFFERTVDSQG